jgi:xylulokinase
VSDRFVLAIDLGTTGLKMGLVSVTGEIAWTSDHDLTTTHLPDGGAEQDAHEWWRLIVDTARVGIASGAVDPARIVAVSTTAQWASTVPVDDDGVPVGACILWSDTRGGRHVRRRIGGPVSGYKATALATWIRRTGGAPSTSGADPIGHILHLEIDQPEVAGAEAILGPDLELEGAADRDAVVEIAAGLAAARRDHLDPAEAALLDVVPVAGGERGEGEGEEQGKLSVAHGLG